MTDSDDRPTVDEALARKLVATQFPRWADLPLTPVVPGGSDHAIYRLGTDLSVRIPRHAGAMRQARKEAKWLPRLAPSLPLPVPVPEAVGEPEFGYPWPWAVHRWTPGETATVEALGESVDCAETLAGFLAALQGCAIDDAADDPDCRYDDDGLADRDADTRERIARLDGVFDAAAMTEVLDAALNAPAWHRPPIWFHGDFHTGNLLTTADRVSAVLDFGSVGIGDPARDMIVAYTLLGSKARGVFRAALGIDDDTWVRGRGWALITALSAYTAYAATHPWVKASTTRQINETLAA